MSRKRLPKVLTDKEWELLKDSFFSQAKPGRLPRYRSPRRNYILSRLIMATGLRVSEVIELCWKHVDLDELRVHVRDGKGGKDRSVPLLEDVAEDLRRWKDEEQPDDPSIRVFRTRNDTPLSRRYIFDTIRRHAHKADLPEADRVGVHTLRHTFATRLLRACGNIRHVQEALGHEDLSTTMIYTRVVDDDLRNSIEEMTV